LASYTRTKKHRDERDDGKREKKIV
jgi:hypothetical protein